MTEPQTQTIHVTIGIYDDYTSNPDQFRQDLADFLQQHDSVHTIDLHATNDDGIQPIETERLWP
jgi:hypothetical protein